MRKVQLNGSAETTARMVTSTALMGVSNAVITLIRIARIKIFAVLLGPPGIGLAGLYDSVMSTAAAIGGMGVGSSGVRQVAQASGDESRMSGTLFSLRFLTISLGILAALGLVLLSKAVSRWIFGNYQYAAAIAVLSFGVFSLIVSGSQGAILNGMRRVGDLALVNIIGTSVGTVLAVIIVWLKGTAVLAYATVFPVMITLACSSWMVRRVARQSLKPSLQELQAEVLTLLKIGIAFMLGGLMMTMTLLITRLILVERLGLAATGLFQAGWGIAVINIDFILAAMGIDFYPHLTGCIKADSRTGNRLVNEQTQVALLLGGPLIIGMLTAASPLLRLFYSAQFAGATDLLRWLLLGSVLKIASWPLAYLLIAHGWAGAWLCLEFVWCSLYMGLVYFGSSHFGVNATGYAFVAAYLMYLIAVYVVAHVKGRFSWWRTNTILSGGLFLTGIIIMMLASRNWAAGYVVGGLCSAAFCVLSVKRLGDMTHNLLASRAVLSLREGLNAVRRYAGLAGPAKIGL